jgi:hypothetical protein
MINTVESAPVPLRGVPLWPLSVAACRALGEMGLIPKIGGHATHGPGGALTSAVLPEFTLGLDGFFAK